MTDKTLVETETGPRHELERRLVEWNDRIIDAANSATTRAFNLGCLVGLIPAALIIGAAFLLTHNSWVGALVMAVLMVLALILFANIAAGLANRNTINRVILQEIGPEVERTLAELHLSHEDLSDIARKTLERDAPLLDYVQKTSPAQVSTSSADN
ncbi:MAG: hypothetical protein IT316_03100 [Anaerolineales bacterium]|nr:hypothetical protein [Anaerolineales bacterium]